MRRLLTAVVLLAGLYLLLLFAAGHLLAQPGVELTVHRARTGPFELTSVISWLLAADELEAEARTGPDRRGRVTYRDGQLTVGAGLLDGGSRTVPFQMPPSDPTALPITQVRTLAMTLIQTVAPERAMELMQERLLDRRLPRPSGG